MADEREVVEFPSSESGNGSWFSARSVIGYDSHFEERVVLFRASDLARASHRATSEAKSYADKMEAWLVGAVLVDLLELEAVGDGAEVYSFFRAYPFAPADYAEALARELENHSREPFD